LVKTIRGHNDEIWDVKWSATNPNLIASGAWDNTARVWNADLGEEIHVYPGHVTDVWSVTFSPDNTILASCGGNQKVKLWDNATGRLIADLSGDVHTADVEEVQFSPDEKYVASASRDGSVRIWEVPKLGKRVEILAQDRFSVWERRQPYEKTKDYQNRLKNKQNFLLEFEKQIVRTQEDFYIQNADWKNDFSLGEYKADQEYFPLLSKNFGELKLRVPIKTAPNFAAQFDRAEFTNLD